jgi:hypothetical protein
MTNEENERIRSVIEGNTYPVREQLKQIGCEWDAARKRWTCDDSQVTAVTQISVPVGGSEQLWEPCSKCGTEPVDGSGLCESCRGTTALRVEELISDEAQAQQAADDPHALTEWTHLKSAVQLNAAPDGVHPVRDIDGPWGGGVFYRLFSDGHDLYLHEYHSDGWASWKRIVKSALVPTDQLIYDILVAREEEATS